MLTLPEIDALFAQTEDFVGLLETIMIQLPWLFVIWLTLVGGAIGSFLNVVVYRMPAGLSISHPPSRCPKCETRIRIQDNVPILSWLVLGGKCRNCKLPIAVRYPLVESMVATLFFLMAMAAVLRTPALAEVPIVFVRFVYYANAAACLVAFALIDFDLHRIPRRLFFYSIVSVVVVPIVWPSLRFVGELDFVTSTFSPRMGSFVAVLVHATCGGIASSVLFWLPRTKPSYLNFVETGTLAGVIAGWWISILPIVAATAIFVRLLPRGDKRDTVSLSLVLVFLVCVVIVLQLYWAAVVYV